MVDLQGVILGGMLGIIVGVFLLLKYGHKVSDWFLRRFP